MTRKLFNIVAVAVLASTTLLAQSTPAPANAGNDVNEKIQKLEQLLAEQQKQIDSLKQKLQQQQTHPASLGEVASTTPMLPAAAVPPQTASNGPTEQPQKKSDALELMDGKVKFGFVGYGSWGIYTQAGFGPQFVTQTSYPGPGNDNYNSFDITRTYLNFLYIPNKHLTIRATPNMYIASDGSHVVRMKYAYAEFNNLFEGSETFKEDNVRFGMQMNPLVDWEEGLYGYRFVSLTPWNYLSLSSTQIGASMNGPIKFGGKQYLDYQIGAFNDASFHDVENSSRKQGMGRLSFYPFGASSKYQGLGLTGFVDYGFSNTAVASEATSGFPVVRVAALAHYTSKKNGAGIAFEYDWGRNAFDAKHLWTSGNTPAGSFAYLNALATSLLTPSNAQGVHEHGYDFFGHINIPNSKFGFFGMFQNFQPNTQLAQDPFDFDRIVAGVAYKLNSHLRFAFDNQDVHYTHSQFTFSSANAGSFPYTGGPVPNAVPKNVQAFFLNMELSF